MCRLYGFRASHPTRMECELLEAQNALILQSRLDETGEGNPDGWGIGLVTADGALTCARQAQPAYESEAFRLDALLAAGVTGLAHVRNATVGLPSPVNTHPFRAGDSMLAHNGDVGAFDQVRPHLLAAMGDADRLAIAGETDSEHVFHLLLSRHAEAPTRALGEVLRATAQDIETWVRDADRKAELALNLLWTVGPALAGTRYDVSLYYTERQVPYDCPMCGECHAEVPQGQPYRAVVVASEPITDERWQEIPDRSVFSIDDAIAIDIAPLAR